MAFAKATDEKAQSLQKALIDALGPHWGKFPRGPELVLEIESFRKTLSSDTLFHSWESSMKAREFKVSGPVLAVTRSSGQTRLAVNFDSDIAEVYREVRISSLSDFLFPYYS